MSEAATLVEQTVDPLEAYNKGYSDFPYFSRLCVPHVIKYNFPDYYVAIWLMLVKARTIEEKKAVLRFALGLPRGFAKTTFIKILICWFLVYDHAFFVVVVCADEPLAYRLLADIDEMLGSHNMEAVYGRWSVNKATDNKEEKTANYRNTPRTLIAVGANSSVRGLNVKHRRPDLILFDDMQTSDNAKSDVESEALLDRFTGTFLKLVSPEGALIVYIGNMYPFNCILAKLKESKSWVSLITGCILATGESLWPDLRSIESLFDDFKNDESLGRAHIWFAEMMNDPILSKTSLLPDGTIPECPFTEEDFERAETGFVVIDPAGFRKLSDDNVIATTLLIDDSLVMVKGTGGVLDPEQVIDEAIAQCLEYNLSVIGVEAVAYQQTLCFWMMKKLKALNLDHIIVVELSPAGRHKESRIIAWIKDLLGKKNDSVKGYYVYGEVRLKILWQALAFKVGKKDNRDDWLDVGAYGLDMRAEYWEEVMTATRIVNASQVAKVVYNNTPF